MSAGRRLLIRGGRVIDPASGRDAVADLLVVDGVVAAVGQDAAAGGGDCEVIEAAGLWVLPGLIDLHTHLREPGYEYKETVLTGARAAAAGGFTAVACMPNTDPPNDSAAVTRAILRKADEAALVRVYPIGCITAGQQGQRMAEFGDLVAAGCRAVSDDGRPVMHAGVMRRALEYSRYFDIPVISHCEDLNLAGDGVAHEGAVATRLGLKPIPAAAEEAMVAREVVLARQTGARVHIAHVSTRGSVSLLAAAKAEGLPVTAEATPHHLTLTDEAIVGFDTATKVNPPLRSRGGPRGPSPRARRGDHRRRRDRPRAARSRRQGSGVRRRGQRDGRARDGPAAGPAARRRGGVLAAPGGRRSHVETGPDPRGARRAARAGGSGGCHAGRPG